MTRIAAITFVAFSLLARATTGQVGTTQTTGERAQRHQTYTQLSRDLFHADDDRQSGLPISADRAEAIQSQLHRVVSDEIIADLTAPGTSATSIADAITEVQQDQTDKPFVGFFQLSGAKELAVGYVILRGLESIPDTQPYLEFYVQPGGTWQRKAKAPTLSDFRGHTFFVAQMNSGIPGEAWFLTWGTTIGNPGVPLKVRLYGFDGATVRTVWKRDDLTRGKISVSSNSVTLEYDREYHSSNPNNRVHEVLNISPNGLQ